MPSERQAAAAATAVVLQSGHDKSRCVFLLQSIFLPVYTAEHPVTKAVIVAIPPDKADYREDSIVRNAIDLAWHIG